VTTSAARVRQKICMFVSTRQKERERAKEREREKEKEIKK